MAAEMSNPESGCTTSSKTRGSANSIFWFNHRTWRWILPVGSRPPMDIGDMEAIAEARPLPPPGAGMAPLAAAVATVLTAFSAASATYIVGLLTVMHRSSTSLRIAIASFMSSMDKGCTTSLNLSCSCNCTLLLSHLTCRAILPVGSKGTISPSGLATGVKGTVPCSSAACSADAMTWAVGSAMLLAPCSISFKIDMASVTSIFDNASTTSLKLIGAVIGTFLFNHATCRPIFPLGSSCTPMPDASTTRTSGGALGS
mmetsp:Transcript_131485/g.380333  ORF Transcript_131485/g.380333 Transcript_131485/m.380333 type:complete len:257 (-) Transcript_131485:649-1419(-)